MADDEIDIPAIAARFLAQAPPLQFPPVLDDVKAVVEDDAIMAAVAPKARKAYNLDQMTSIDVPDGGKFLVTEFAEVGENEYLDPKAGKVHTVNHMEKTVSGSRDATPEEIGGAMTAAREAVQTEIETYTASNFSDSVMSASYVKDGKIMVCISGAEFDARNMWSGRWRSMWECAIEGDEVQLKGTFKVDVHFYEDGNVQSKSTHEVSETIGGGGSEADTASAIVAHIKESETKYQSLLDGAYVNLLKDHSIMNGLRRPLPIDKQKVNFKTLVSQGRLAGSLR